MDIERRITIIDIREKIGEMKVPKIAQSVGLSDNDVNPPDLMLKKYIHMSTMVHIAIIPANNSSHRFLKVIMFELHES